MLIYQLKITLIIFQSCDHSDHNHSPSPVITIEYFHHQLPINWIWQITKRASKITSVQWHISDVTSCQMLGRLWQSGYDSRFFIRPPQTCQPAPIVSSNPPWLIGDKENMDCLKQASQSFRKVFKQKMPYFFCWWERMCGSNWISLVGACQTFSHHHIIIRFLQIRLFIWCKKQISPKI